MHYPSSSLEGIDFSKNSQDIETQLLKLLGVGVFEKYKALVEKTVQNLMWKFADFNGETLDEFMFENRECFLLIYGLWAFFWVISNSEITSNWDNEELSPLQRRRSFFEESMAHVVKNSSLEDFRKNPLIGMLRDAFLGNSSTQSGFSEMFSREISLLQWKLQSNNPDYRPGDFNIFHTQEIYSDCGKIAFDMCWLSSIEWLLELDELLSNWLYPSEILRIYCLAKMHKEISR